VICVPREVSAAVGDAERQDVTEERCEAERDSSTLGGGGGDGGLKGDCHRYVTQKGSRRSEGVQTCFLRPEKGGGLLEWVGGGGEERVFCCFRKASHAPGGGLASEEERESALSENVSYAGKGGREPLLGGVSFAFVLVGRGGKCCNSCGVFAPLGLPVRYDIALQLRLLSSAGVWVGLVGSFVQKKIRAEPGGGLRGGELEGKCVGA